jgi:uncharacterized protein
MAQVGLGLMYYTGQGVAKDAVEAVKWYRKGAEQGYAMAQVVLGVKYAFGKGVPKDEVRAYMWLLLAGSKGIEVAKKNYGILEKSLTPQQRAEGQRMAREWKPAKSTE